MVKFQEKVPPRSFKVGVDGTIMISDCGECYLDSDEQITFVSSKGKEYDFAAKSWGFYATPSINRRLKSFGYKTALVANADGAIYVMVVDSEKIDDFHDYCEKENQVVLEWLSDRPCK